DAAEQYYPLHHRHWQRCRGGRTAQLRERWRWSLLLSRRPARHPAPGGIGDPHQQRPDASPGDDRRASGRQLTRPPLAGRQAPPQLLRPDLQQVDGALAIGADALTPQGNFANLLTTRALVTGPDRQTRSISLVQDAPGHYAATLPSPSPGAYRITLAQYDGAS